MVRLGKRVPERLEKATQPRPQFKWGEVKGTRFRDHRRQREVQSTLENWDLSSALTGRDSITRVVKLQGDKSYLERVVQHLQPLMWMRTIPTDLSKDGIRLNDIGTFKLRDNFVKHLNVRGSFLNARNAWLPISNGILVDNKSTSKMQKLDTEPYLVFQINLMLSLKLELKIQSS